MNAKQISLLLLSAICAAAAAIILFVVQSDAQVVGCMLPGSTAKDCATITHNYAAEITIIGKPDDAKIFDMDENACLRGGLTFYDLDGKVIFDLKPGEHYPAGCDKR